MIRVEQLTKVYGSTTAVQGLDFAVEKAWRAAGLHRLQHRVISVEQAAGEVVVRSRVAPPAQAFGMFATYRWTVAPDAVPDEVTPGCATPACATPG